MFLKQTKQRNGRISLSVVQSYRENGKPKSRSVETFGFLDELEDQYDDPIAHFKAICDQMNAEYRSRTAPVTITIHPTQKVDTRTTNRKNVGCSVSMAFYHALGIEGVLNNKQATSKVKYDLNAVMRLLINERLMNPGSKMSAFENSRNYFYKSEFSDDDLYRSLDTFAKVKDSLISAANKGIARLCARDTTNVFYDVTNYHFECEEDGFKNKGVSKHHQPKPRVQMGLLQDADAIPMTYKLFSGNTHDSQAMIDVLHDMKRDFCIKRVVCVADKGLNCSSNIAATTARGDGFVYSQSIRGTKSSDSLRAWVIDASDYEAQEDGAFKVKSKQGYKVIAAEDDKSNTKQVRIEVKYVAFWSRKYEARARHDREKTLEKARQLIACPGQYTRATHWEAAKYVQGVVFDKKTGECIEGSTAPVFDKAALARDEACDGYYLIVTSETGWSDEKIIDTYRGLWRIEESFKITKSDLTSRPVFVRTRAHVEAHFLTCYISLVILRLMQKATNYRHSTTALLNDLRQVNCSLIEDNWWHFDYRSDLTDELFALIGESAPVRYMRTGDIKSLLAKKKLQPIR